MQMSVRVHAPIRHVTWMERIQSKSRIEGHRLGINVLKKETQETRRRSIISTCATARICPRTVLTAVHSIAIAPFPGKRGVIYCSKGV